MIVKLLTEHHLEFLNLTGGCGGSSESALVKMSNCWKSQSTAHLIFTFTLAQLNLDISCLADCMVDDLSMVSWVMVFFSSGCLLFIILTHLAYRANGNKL